MTSADQVAMADSSLSGIAARSVTRVLGPIAVGIAMASALTTFIVISDLSPIAPTNTVVQILLTVTAVAAAEDPRGNENLSVAVERHLSRYFAGFENGLPPPGLYHRVLREIEYPLLTAALTVTRGNQIRAADLLGVNRNTLRKKIRDLDIQVVRTSG